MLSGILSVILTIALVALAAALVIGAIYLLIHGD